jgi:hypothetical protein
MATRKWDLTSTNSLSAAAEWMRKSAGAHLVLVVRAEDFAFAVDGAISPKSAAAMVESMLGEMAERLNATRVAAREELRKKQDLKGVFDGR